LHNSLKKETQPHFVTKTPHVEPYRLWKWYATALGNPVKLPKAICNRFRQPLMETVCNRLSSYLPCYATAYGNGVSPSKIPQTAALILKKG
jgi:hypothetical protein